MRERMVKGKGNKVVLLVTALALIAMLFVYGCGGGGGSDTATGTLSVMLTPASLVSYANQEVDDTVTLMLTWDSSDTMSTLPLDVQSADLVFTRTDCPDCATLSKRSLPVGLFMRAGESMSVDIPIVRASDKRTLPLLATRTDGMNYILGGTTQYASREEFVGHLFAKVLGVYGQSGDPVSGSDVIGNGDGSQTWFVGTVTETPIDGTVNVFVDGSLIGYDDGSGNIVSVSTPPSTDNSGYYTDTLGTGDGATTQFGGVLTEVPTAGSVTVLVGSTAVAHDDGQGNIVDAFDPATVIGSVSYSGKSVSVNLPSAPASGTSVTVSYYFTDTATSTPPANNIGTIDASTRTVRLNIEPAPADGATITVSYAYYPSTGESNFDFYLNNPVSPGSIVLMLGSEQIAKDNGVGSIFTPPDTTGSYVVTGTINYGTGYGSLSISPDITAGEGNALTLTAYYVMQSRTQLSNYPVTRGTVSVRINGTEVCTDNGGGGFNAPCFGSIDYQNGVLTGLSVDGTMSSVTNVGSITVAYQTESESLGGDILVDYADGNTSEYVMNLHFPPVAPPATLSDGNPYYLVIESTDGLRIWDVGGQFSGDVCGNRTSTIDYDTGRVDICFNRPVGAGEKVIAYYRTQDVTFNAHVTIYAKETEGRTLTVERDISVTVTGEPPSQNQTTQ